MELSTLYRKLGQLIQVRGDLEGEIKLQQPTSNTIGSLQNRYDTVQQKIREIDRQILTREEVLENDDQKKKIHRI